MDDEQMWKQKERGKELEPGGGGEVTGKANLIRESPPYYS
jgi:hypothetical protein